MRLRLRSILTLLILTISLSLSAQPGGGGGPGGGGPGGGGGERGERPEGGPEGMQEEESTSSNGTGRVSMTVVDNLLSEPIAGVVAELTPNDTIKYARIYGSSDHNGNIRLNAVPYTRYTVRLIMLGYEEQSDKFSMNRASVDLGTIEMSLDAQDIEMVRFNANAIRTSQRGDTLVYNAESFKVSADADLQDLLAKMPGIQVSDGTVEAQGEEVKKVLVDGRELFGDDVNSAISNLPAEAVKEVEVFDKLSDEAEFSGIDDGEGYKAINIVTQPGMRNGTFGKLYGSYVFDDMYNVSAAINSFNEDRKISILAMSNNVNQQNYSVDDLLGTMSSKGGRSGGGGGGGGGGGMLSSQSGVSTVNAFSANYSDKLSEKVSVTAGYFFSSNENILEQITERQYTLTADSLQLYNNEEYTYSDNYNHRFTGMLDWTINKNNMFMFRPSLSFQDYASNGTSVGENTILSDDEYSSLNSFDEYSISDKFGYNISNAIIFRHKFSDNGRSMMVSANGNWTKNDNDAISYSYTKYMTPVYDTTLNQNSITNTSSYTLRGELIYIEPISKEVYLTANYKISYANSDTDKRAYMYNALTGGYDDFSASLSNTYSSIYTTHTVGPGVRYNADKTMVVANLNYQYSSLDGEQTYPIIDEPITTSTFEDLTYFTMINYRINSQQSLRFMLQSNTSNPSVTQLQDVVDISDMSSISSGNPDLQPSYTHNGTLRYILSNVRRGSTLMASLSASLVNDYIAQDVTIAQGSDMTLSNGVELLEGSQFSIPVNIDGYKKFSGNISYGMPVGFIRSNVNLDLGIDYTELPSVINDLTNMTETTAYSGGVVVGSNISEYVDFTVSYKGAYNVATNSIQTSSDNTYISQSAALRMKLEPFWGITINATGSYNQYRGITDDYNEEYVILNLSLGKRIFKNQRGEISIGVDDIFDQNTSFYRNVTDTYIENVTTNVLGRMASIKFTYNLRVFHK